MNTVHKYPVGIQTFERLRKENYLYIDKTDLVWKMTKESPFVFLSRPRPRKTDHSAEAYPALHRILHLLCG